MFGLGFGEILVILVIGMLLFGPKKMPGLAKSVARGIVYFKRQVNEVKNYVNTEISKATDNEFNNFDDFKRTIDQKLNQLSQRDYAKLISDNFDLAGDKITPKRKSIIKQIEPVKAPKKKILKTNPQKSKARPASAAKKASITKSEPKPKYELVNLCGTTELVLSKKNKLIPEVSLSFSRMQKSAAKDGIILQLYSGYRSFEDQNNIWSKKMKINADAGMTEEQSIAKIIRYSAIPGTSRHHWGTDVDIIGHNIRTSDPLLTRHFTSGPYQTLNEWLSLNAEKFNFIQAYTSDKQRTGFNYEPWHYSYWPLSKEYISCFNVDNWLDLQLLKQIAGNNYITKSYINKYFKTHLSGIHPDLK